MYTVSLPQKYPVAVGFFYVLSSGDCWLLNVLAYYFNICIQ